MTKPKINNNHPYWDPPLDCPKEDFCKFAETLEVGEKVIECGRSGMTGQTGEIVMSTQGHGKCVQWDTKFQEGPGKMVTSLTGGTRRLAAHPIPSTDLS